MQPTSDSSRELLEEAQQHHRAKRFDEAGRLYRRIVDTNPEDVVGWYHLGLAYLGQNKLAEATETFQQVLILSPSHFDALTQMGITYSRQKRLLDAVARFREAIALRPGFAPAHYNLGVALTQLGERDEGLGCYQEAVRLQPDYADAHFNLGVALSERGQSAAAIAAYTRALQLREDFLVLFNLGLLLLQERRAAEAIVCLEQAVRLKADNVEVHTNLSLAFAELGRFEDALAICDAALRLRPLDAKTHMNRGHILFTAGRPEESVASYDFALRLRPDYVSAHWNRSLAWLAQGDFERGWLEYEWRWKRPETKSRHSSERQWQGEALEGKTILLWCEQGIGDNVQFIRYARLLKQRGATIWLECPADMAQLLSTCPGVDRVFYKGMPKPVGHDYHAPLMSLPHRCGTTLASIPREIPYLSAPAGMVEQWRQEFAAAGSFKIGITWQGNPNHHHDRHRSFAIHWFGLLAALEGVELYSLQKGVGTEQLATACFRITDLRGRLDERGAGLEQTAAAIQALDLIVTCDTAVAHLAGALGVPVWVPLSVVSDWRWLRDREDSPWYPTMRLFRQAKLGDWRHVFERMRDAIYSLALRAVKRTSPDRRKILDWSELLAVRAEARAAGKKVVWTNGCFDLLHVGHISNLQAARGHGDLLIVGLNSDASVSRLKGPGRPVVNVAERSEVLAALACVDCVVVFDEDTPLKAIARLTPDIHCKGADYAPPDGKPIPEAAVIEAYGGRIEYIPLVLDASTTDIIERIQGRRN